MADTPELVVSRCLKDFAEDEQPHILFCTKVERRYRAYRGILDLRSEAAAWTAKQAPKYVLQVVETMVANLLDPIPTWKLKARPRYDTAEQVARYISGARANELLLGEQVECDHYAEKQRVYGLQGLITGLTAKKNYWNFREERVSRQETYGEPLHDTFGNQIGSVSKRRNISTLEAVRDDPTSEVIDVRDLIWHQAAVSLAKAMRITHRVWMSFDELKELEQRGVYGSKAGGQAIDELKESRDLSGSYTERERDLHNSDRTKDQIEVLECWIERGRRVVSIANRKVLLRDRPNPFWFQRLEHPYPFTVCSAMPDLFVIPGISEVEVMQDIQDMIWSLRNQQLDNLQLLNNVITVVRGDVDLEAFEWAPGAYWPVGDLDVNAAVKPLEINPQVVELASHTLSSLKEDLQNIPGASPTLLGQLTGSAAQTATEVSLTTTLAQRRVAAKKMQFSWSQARDGEQWLALNQQFLDRPRLVEILGADGAAQFEEIRPEMIQGAYSIQLAAMDESLLRQERRAEKSALFQVVMNAIPAFAALKQSNPALPIPNVKAILDDVFEAYGINDKERYWSAQPAPAAQLPAPTQQQQAFLQGPGGLTSPLASDMNSPSHVTSQSPVASLQQQGAMSGGPVNVG